MPELPEVETLRQDLFAHLIRKTISKCEVSDLRLITGRLPNGRPRRRVTKKDMANGLEGRCFVGFIRRGKFLIFQLDNSMSLILHLRMSGQLLLTNPLPQARAQLSFLSTEAVLNICDQRRFGEMWLSDDWRHDVSIKQLGPDALCDDWEACVWDRLQCSSQKVAAALLNQTLISGLGNIYVTEALFQSGLSPAKRCHDLTRCEFDRLVLAIRKSLQMGLTHRGVSFSTFRDLKGRLGKAGQHLKVFRRSNQPCVQCAVLLSSEKIGGRRVVFCRKCQRSYEKK